MVTIQAAVEAVPDPEIRVVTIADLGILRAVEHDDAGHVTVTITPTYTGCPAMDVIRRDIVSAAEKAGAVAVEVRTELSPPWSTDWISDAGRAKLAAAGTAPPHKAGGRTPLRLTMRCPRCGSADTEELSRFGSTACKALWRCRACRDPFDSIKAY